MKDGVFFEPGGHYGHGKLEIWVVDVDRTMNTIEYVNAAGFMDRNAMIHIHVPGIGNCDMIVMGDDFIASYMEKEEEE
jgi:hypothetical protein